MSLPIFCWVATGDSNMFNSYGHFYQALNMPASAVYDETSLVRKALTVRRGSSVMARNYALSGWRITDLEAQAAELDSLINADHVPTAGRRARHYPLIVCIGTNQTETNPAAACARIRTYLLARQSAGFLPLICTLPSNTYLGVGETGMDVGVLQPMSAIIRTWGESDGVYGVIDHAADTNIGGTGAADNITWFDSNRIHPNAAAVRTYMAPRTLAAMSALMVSLGALAVPTGLVATPAIGDVQLVWDTVSDATWRVYRSTADNFQGATLVATVTAANHSQAGTSGTTYYFWVTRYNSTTGEETIPTLSVTATPA